MRVACYDNLGNNAYEQAKSFRRLGVDADVVVDPLDTFVMSDTRWEDLDLELPTERLDRAELPEDAPVPDWVRRPPPTARDARSRAGLAEGALRSMPACVGGLRRGGLYGAYLVAVRSWVLRTLREYDVVFARGAGPAWCALAHVRCIAQTYGGDITIAPFLDQPSFAGAEHAPASTASREDRAVARLQRHGLQRSERVLLSDPRFFPFARRLGLADRAAFVPFVLDTEKFVPGQQLELRRQLLGENEGPLVFVPSRQDWRWKGSDRILQGFAEATAGRPEIRLVCSGWGSDLERSQALAAELGLRDRTVFLPNALSKSRLVRYLQAADGRRPGDAGVIRHLSSRSDELQPPGCHAPGCSAFRRPVPEASAGTQRRESRGRCARASGPDRTAASPRSAGRRGPRVGRRAPRR